MSLLTNLVAAYTFETSGSSIGNDLSGNGRNLTKTGTVNQSAGNASPGTNAATWTDSGGFSPLGTLHGNFNYIPVATDLSFSAWVYVLSGSWNTTPYDMWVLGSFNTGADQYGLFLKQSTKEFYFTVSGGGAGGPTIVDGQGAISFSTWYFVYCEWDFAANKMRISRNNSTLAEAAGPTTPYASPVDFCIGSNGHGAGFTMDGRTDAVNVWNRKLTADERTLLYNSGAGLEYPFPSGRRSGSFISFL